MLLGELERSERTTASLELLVVDAREGVQPPTRARLEALHARGLRECAVAIVRMDRVGNEYEAFKAVRDAVIAADALIAARHGRPGLEMRFFPLTERRGVTLAPPTAELEWFEARTAV